MTESLLRDVPSATRTLAIEPVSLESHWLKSPGVSGRVVSDLLSLLPAKGSQRDTVC